MVYIVLNILAIVVLVFLIRAFDKNVKTTATEISSLMISLLLLTIESVIFTVTLLFCEYWALNMIQVVMKLMYMVDGIFFVCFFYALIDIGLSKRNKVVTFLKILSYVGIVVYVVHFIKSIDVSLETGMDIYTDYIFSSETVQQFFPWTWATLYNAVTRVFLPSLGCLIMLLLREKNATPLLKFQGILFMEAIILTWVINYLMQFICLANPSFQLLHIYPYIIMFSLLYFALLEKTVPSGRGFLISFAKGFLAYLVPGALLGLILCLVQPAENNMRVTFVLAIIAMVTATVILGWQIYDFIMYGSRITTADYERNFERDLGTVNYNQEMDQVTKHMFEVFRNNVECSSMNVYIDDGHGMLSTAYSSNNFDFKTPINAPVFEGLLNENRNIIIYSEIEDAHEYDNIRDDLKQLFEDAKCDAMFILNEGHNIVGIITLGRKISGDHFKEYDKNVFQKLYSYFFVFGYYMRNISNKDILGTVNREIKMSSQIITSIQENIDHIKSNKVDVGYLMVPSHNIGGEFIDLIRLTDTRHLIVVGDLSGKGIAASMNMVILKSIIRTYLAEIHDFKKLVAKINVFIRESLQKGTIFAGLFALVDFETDTMYYINCGIPALFMYAQVYNNVIEIQGSGHVLGFVKDITPYLSVKTTKLNRGDILFCCTDGLINSHSLRGEKFGKERITQQILLNSTYPAQRMAQFTFEELIKFMSKEMEDDVSILCMKYKTSAEFADIEEDKKEEPAEAENTEENVEATSETPVAEGNNDVVEESDVQAAVNETSENFEETLVNEENRNETVQDAPATETEKVENNASESFAEPSIFEVNDLTFSGSDVPEEPDREETVSEAADDFEFDPTAIEDVSMDFFEDKPAKKEDSMFINDLSEEDSKEDTEKTEFNPADFGLPPDFEL